MEYFHYVTFFYFIFFWTFVGYGSCKFPSVTLWTWRRRQIMKMEMSSFSSLNHSLIDISITGNLNLEYFYCSLMLLSFHQCEVPPLVTFNPQRRNLHWWMIMNTRIAMVANIWNHDTGIKSCSTMFLSFLFIYCNTWIPFGLASTINGNFYVKF